MIVPSLTIHASAIVVDNRGVVIEGPSGSGKSQLAGKLVDVWKKKKHYASWIGDDQIELRQLNNAVLASSAKNISGLREIRFGGIEMVEHQSQSVIDLIVELVPTEHLQRLPIQQTRNYFKQGTMIPCLQVPKEKPEMAVSLISNHLTSAFLDVDCHSIDQN